MFDDGAAANFGAICDTLEASQERQAYRMAYAFMGCCGHGGLLSKSYSKAVAPR